MKKYLLLAICLIIALGFSFIFVKSWWSENKQDKAKCDPLYWVAPMDPTFRSNKPGKSPMGMDLVPVCKGNKEASKNTSEVTINPNIEENLGVRTTRVKRMDLSRPIDTVGFITVDENRIQHIHTFADGWVRTLAVRTTDAPVTKGQLLFELHSPTLNNAQEEYLLALRSKDSSLLNAALGNLDALGFSDKQIENLSKTKKSSNLVQYYSKESGVVSELNIREGMYVTPQIDTMVIEDLSSIWIMAEVYEKEANWVHIGETAYANLVSIPGRIWQGKVEYVYPHLDPKTRTLRVRLRFDNKDLSLKPNMYANVKIQAPPIKQTLVIPAEAIIRTGGQQKVYVILALGHGRFRAQPIKIGIQANHWVQVISGLQEGQKIVTSGQFLIDSESNIKASLNRLSDTENNSNKEQTR